MKLSEAILLGSTVVKSQPGIQITTDLSQGCVLGMAAIGSGTGFTLVEGPPGDRTGGNFWELRWPWMNVAIRRPCWCWPLRTKMPVKGVIAHLFDRHVNGKKNWTLDELVRWVATVEPQDADQEQSSEGVGTSGTQTRAMLCRK